MTAAGRKKRGAGREEEREEEKVEREEARKPRGARKVPAAAVQTRSLAPKNDLNHRTCRGERSIDLERAHR